MPNIDRKNDLHTCHEGCECQIPKPIAEGTITIFGVSLRCYVLDDGRRLLNAEDMYRLFEVMGEPDCPEPDETELTSLARFIHGLRDVDG